jgi:hypothetical protein
MMALTLLDTSNKKAPPTRKELDFIQIASRIHTGEALTPKEINDAVSGELNDTAHELARAMQKSGQEGFWTVWTALAHDNKRLINWRPLVEIPPAPIPSSEEQKRGKYRPTTLLEMAQRPRPNDIIEDIFYEKTIGELFASILQTLANLFTMSPLLRSHSIP